MTDVELVIFDCDGVLIDSEVLANASEVAFLQSFGIDIELQDYMMRFVGKSNKDVLKELQAQHNNVLPDDFWILSEKQTFKIFHEELEPMAGIVELLSTIVQAKCIGSSSSLERLEVSLKAVGLYERFAPSIFSSEQVARGKPAPDLFLFAAEKMQVANERCLVIEDSPYGVRAAVDAGMHVIGFTGGSHIMAGHEERLLNEGALAVYADMASVADALDEGLRLT